jgi:hypothetical protein
MEAELHGRPTDARDLFLKAWAARTDDFEASIAAHYVARHQTDPKETLAWNQIALDRADAVADDRVKGFYASLYLNLGRSYEDLGSRDEAARYYRLAEERLPDVPEGAYGDILRRGVAEARKRFTSSA